MTLFWGIAQLLVSMRARAFTLVSLFLMCVASQAKTTPEAEFANLDAGRSRRVFLNLMSDPIIHTIFHNLQRQMLNTREDSAMRDFISSNSVLSKIATAYRESQDGLLEDFSREAQVTMLQVKRGMTEKYDLLDRLVTETAIDLGFSEAAIAKREIYVQHGGPNAFTVSGNQGRIIVVVTSDLLKTLTISELRGILGHELGHIRSGHTIDGQVSSLVMSLIARLYSNGPSSNMLGQEDLSDWARFDRMLSFPHVQEKHLGYRRYQISKNDSVAQRNRKQAMDMLSSMPVIEQRKLLGRYMEILIEAMQEAGAHSSSVNYFKYLRRNLKDLGTFSIRPDEFSFFADEALAAVSRMNERSADHYAASIISNLHLASAFAKLLGVEFARPERDLILAQLRRQAQYFQESYRSDDKAPHVGHSHPALALRIDFLMGIPNYPTVAFANPFLRLLVLHQALVDYAREYKNLGKQDAEAKAALKGVVARIEHQKASLSQEIVNMIGEIGWARISNPRFANLLQYSLVQRELTIARLESLRAISIEQSEIQPLLQQFETAFRNPNELLMAVQRALREAKKALPLKSPERVTIQEREHLMHMALNSVNREELHQARRAITLSKDGSERGTRIATRIGAPVCAQIF